jgi:hypothetical protein
MNQILFTCCCCFDSKVELNQVIACPDNHITCSDCLQRSLNVAVGEQSIIHCFHESGCDKEYTEIALNRALPESKLKKSYDLVLANKSLRESGIENLHTCALCDNTVVLPNDTPFSVFYCKACDKYSCNSCEKERHDGPCDTRLRKEEEETNRLLLKCVCNAKLLRGDGCNHLVCSNCRSHWCWICKEMLKGDRYTMYAHFDRDHAPDQEKCPMYGDRKKEQVFAPRPETLTSKRKLMYTEIVPEQVTFGEGCCSRNPDADAAATSSGSIGNLKTKKQKVIKTMCQGKLKGTGRDCVFYAKIGKIYCGHHKDQVV